MIALATATFIWTLGFYLESLSSTLGQQLFFNNIGYIGSMSVPVIWFIFTLEYTTDRRVTAWGVLPYCIIPAITLVLVWTNNWHHLMWSNEHLGTSGAFTVTVKTYGTFFWVMVVYNYVLIITGAIVLIRRLWVGVALYRGQAISLIVAAVLPMMWNVIYIFNLVTLPRKDLTPVAFTISGIVIILGLMRFQLFRVVPLAREYLFQQLHIGVLAFDMNGRLLEANPEALTIFGVDSNIIGKNGESLSRLSPVLERLSSAEAASVRFPVTISGEELVYEMESISMKDKTGHQMGRLAILRDVTEQKNIQEQLMSQDRLASIGLLTAGFSHELNNPLSNIVGFSELLRKRDLPADIRADVNIISEEAERASRIVDDLLTFARKHSDNQAPIDINKTLEKTLELIAHREKTNNIRIISQFAADLPEIMGDTSQLMQVFLNIIINAEYFMIKAHGKGTLTIVTEQVENFIHITFADDGPGIPPENISHIFTPFYTTKEVGKGTGLGLSICHGIVTKHGGRIWADSRPGEGATFTVELPVYIKPAKKSG
jgi:PAS domain S-box-containing protein